MSIKKTNTWTEFIDDVNNVLEIGWETDYSVEQLEELRDRFHQLKRTIQDMRMSINIILSGKLIEKIDE